MALNPFFLHGSSSEQRLVQELINEQLRMYGVEVIYIPRKIVSRDNIIREITSSKFDDNYAIEAYVNNYDGYSGSGDILSKFGVSLKDELLITISKERFEDFIAVFLNSEDPDEIILASRPREGDLIYFPLGQRIFEVKFVEHETPFYQLGKTYVYELKCELFEYEDEIVETTIEEVDNLFNDHGYINTLQMFPSGTQATATSVIGTGYVRSIILNNDGYGYTSAPNVSISTAPVGGINATAVAITTVKNKKIAIQEILLTHAGSGYVTEPNITITGGGGIGAAATCSVVTSGKKGVISISITNGGVGYSTTPNVIVGSPALSPNLPAVLKAVVSSTGTISAIRISNSGEGFYTSPTITVGLAATVGIGTFWFNEIVTGSISGSTARVKKWDKDTSILNIAIIDGSFIEGENIVGSASSSKYGLKKYNTNAVDDKYQQNTEIEEEADLILDFSESNPFGDY